MPGRVFTGRRKRRGNRFYQDTARAKTENGNSFLSLSGRRRRIEKGANKSVASLKGATHRGSSCGSHRASSATLALDFFAHASPESALTGRSANAGDQGALSDDRGLLEQAAGATSKASRTNWACVQANGVAEWRRYQVESRAGRRVAGYSITAQTANNLHRGKLMATRCVPPQTRCKPSKRTPRVRRRKWSEPAMGREVSGSVTATGAVDISPYPSSV